MIHNEYKREKTTDTKICKLVHKEVQLLSSSCDGCMMAGRVEVHAGCSWKDGCTGAEHRTTRLWILEQHNDK